jgi:hypothetical protein
MFVIGETVIDEAVIQSSFCCDLEKCKGACCCIEGGRGAPLEDDEVLEIEKAYPVVKQYLSRKSIQTIESSGLYDGSPGDFATACVDHQACVFTFFENGVARCGFERVFDEGKTDWRKPLSCHLFPIRVTRFGKDVVRYEQIDECRGGREHGESLEVKLYEFLKEPLVRKYGEKWCVKLIDQCETKLVK